MLEFFGDGETAPCYWCGVRLSGPALEQDRLIEGGRYERGNIVPACSPCNRERSGPRRTHFRWHVPRSTIDEDCVLCMELMGTTPC